MGLSYGKVPYLICCSALKILRPWRQTMSGVIFPCQEGVIWSYIEFKCCFRKILWKGRTLFGEIPLFFAPDRWELGASGQERPAWLKSILFSLLVKARNICCLSEKLNLLSQAVLCVSSIDPCRLFRWNRFVLPICVRTLWASDRSYWLLLPLLPLLQHLFALSSSEQKDTETRKRYRLF